MSLGPVGKRLSVLLAIVVAGLVVALVLPRLMLTGDAARQELVEQIEVLTSAEVAVTGDVEFSVLPSARLVAGRVEIGPGSGISIDRIIADLDPIDALFGKATISRVELIRPEYRPERFTYGDAAAAGEGIGGPGGSLAALDAFEDLVRVAIERVDTLETVVIRDGVWRAEDLGTAPSGFSNANLQLTRASEEGPLRIDGSFIWNGQPAELDMRVASAEQLVAGASSAVELEFSAPPLSLSFDGDVDFGSLRRLSGEVSIASQSIERTHAWLRDPSLRVPDLGGVSIDANVQLNGRKLAFSDATLGVSGSSGRGALEYDLDERLLSGTLAFPRLEFDPIAAAVVPPPTGPFNLRRPIDVGFSETLELNLRVSAATAVFGPVVFEDVAAVLGVSHGRIGVDIGDAGLFGGRAYGRVELVREDASKAKGLEARGRISASGVDTGRALRAFGVDGIGLTGQGRMEASFEAPADDWEAAIKGFTSQASLVTTDGVLSGFDPTVFATAGGRQLFDGVSDGEIPFVRLEAELRSRGPEIAIRSLELDDGGGRLEARGAFSLSDRSLALDGSYDAVPQIAVLAQAGEAEFTTSKPVAFTLGGQWPNPTVVTHPVAEQTAN